MTDGSRSVLDAGGGDTIRRQLQELQKSNHVLVNEKSALQTQLNAAYSQLNEVK